MKEFRIKTFDGYTPADIVKAAKQEDSTLEVLVSVMNVKDSDGDMVMPGAFTKTLKDRGPDAAKPRIKHLWQHNTWEPIGVPLKMEEKEVEIKGEKLMGLVALTKFDSSQFSQDKYKQHLDGVITEFSFGYEVIGSEKCNDDEDEDKKGEYQKLTELKLWEYSSVTWGANKYTAIIKNLKAGDPQAITELEERFKILTGAMKSSRYNDDDKEQFELELMQIKEMVFSLLSGSKGFTRNEPAGATQEDEVKEALEMINIFRKQLKF